MSWLRSTPSFRLRAGYLAAMGIVAAAVLWSFVARDASMDEMKSDAHLVNIAGRQRMLSQRIAAKTAVLADAARSGDPSSADDAAAALRAARSLWADSQHELLAHYTAGDDRTGVEHAPEIAALFERMGPAHASVLDDTAALLALHEDGVLDADRLGGVTPARVARRADEFLPIMHETVGAIEARANDKLASHERSQTLFLVVTLSAIVLAGALVFEPLVRWHALLTARLRDAADEAEEGSRAKTAFLANMSHEIRTPMTAIIGYSKLLADEPDAEVAERAEWGRTIENNARHLLALINDILDVSKIEAGRMTIERVDTDPAVIAEEVLSLLRLQASRKGIDLDLAYETPIPDLIESDPVRLRQIALNIVGNAVKFTERGGVSIGVACDADAERLVLTVRDSGEGMTAGQLEKIRRFEAFSQADATTTRRFGGTGLGLKLCNTLIGLMGGELAIESRAGEGSTFTVTLPTGDLAARTLRRPVRHESEAAKVLARTTESKPLAGLRVLLAEDGPDNRRLFERFLVTAGAEFRCVENGALLCELIASGAWRPHVILLDMQMPVLDGYGAANRLRKMGSQIPVIALTANAMANDRRDCLDAGCDDYLSKPVNRAELVALTAEWATRARDEAA